MNHKLLCGSLVCSGFLLALTLAPEARAFCGFYVAKADAKLFNRTSQVVLVRDGDRTVITMSNDFSGEPSEFAMVVPVPTFLEREQIRVADRALIDHLDAWSAPRLAEYYDPDPCRIVRERRGQALFDAPVARPAPSAEEVAAGVRIEARYTVGEYDIVLLDADRSDSLQVWLDQNGYRVPAAARPVLESYIKLGTRFFVARVNLGEQARLGYQLLRPLQIAFESPRFMLPIRLGTVNADGPQDLVVYTLTRRGRVETTNYRTVKLPTGQDLPAFVKDEFGEFYTDLFDEQLAREGTGSVFLEYAWNMASCDPCAADPLSGAQLRELGAWWVDPERRGAANVFATRLRVRYDAEHFPEDLMLAQTEDTRNFQGRWVLRHPYTGASTCAAADRYREQLRERREREAATLAHLTGRDVGAIRARMQLHARAPERDRPWWRAMWEDLD